MVSTNGLFYSPTEELATCKLVYSVEVFIDVNSVQVLFIASTFIIGKLLNCASILCCLDTCKMSNVKWHIQSYSVTEIFTISTYRCSLLIQIT